MMTERIEQMRKSQTGLSGLKLQLNEAKSVRDFKTCANIQTQIDELKVIFLYLTAVITSTFTRTCP